MDDQTDAVPRRRGQDYQYTDSEAVSQRDAGRCTPEARSGSPADTLGGLRDVRFPLKSGHRLCALRCQLSATFGLTHHRKRLFDHLVGGRK